MTAIYLPATSERELGLESRNALLEAEVATAMHQLRLSKESTQWVGSTRGLECFITTKVVGAQPMGFICLANRRDRTRSLLIPLNQLWTLLTWAGDAGSTRHQAMQAMAAANDAAERLYGFATRQNSIDVLDAMHTFAEDFKNAKPVSGITTKEWLAANAEDGVTFTVDDKAVHV